jgi:hypothetical protein
MFYVRTSEPSPTLKKLVIFIQKIYAPMWFIVKKEASFTRGPKILFSLIHDVKSIDETGEIAAIVLPVLQRSAFCCLPENFLASLVFSADATARDLGVQQIKVIRSMQPKEIGPNTLPHLNFDAEDWTQMIDVSVAAHEPPTTKHLTDEELEAMRKEQRPPPRYPPHSQSVERAVKLTSESAKFAFTYQKRHEYILATVVSRQKRKAFSSKKKYNVTD